MLHVFPITLTGAAKRWVDRLPPGIVDSWDLLEKAFIQRYCPLSKTAKQLEEIYNFKQEGDETLYKAWEWYNDYLYKFPTHDINNHQKVNIFYNSLGAMNRQFFDSQGLIPGFSDNKKQETNNSGMAEALAVLKATLKKKREEPKKEKYGKVSKMTRERILKDYWRERFINEEDDFVENLEDLEECREDKANKILGVIHDKLYNDCFNNTSEDEDDLEWILDYLKPISYDGFIDLDDETYNKRRFSLQRNGILGLLDSCSYGRKVMYRCNHKGYAVIDVITAKILH
uniref:Retrotransposon gag domain-containing protein n=1 Tax=Tanacetum cinerariifolium TaxID=118510 RepID=A0A6L2N5Z2_TANCI|nr:hypothetical protein [Tanacetum cinerariifolium]